MSRRPPFRSPSLRRRRDAVRAPLCLLLAATAAAASVGCGDPALVNPEVDAGEASDAPVDAAVDTPAAAVPVSYSGLVGYWRFDEMVGRVATDSSPTAGAGDLQGGAMLTGGGFPRARFANPGSLVLDGVDGRVALPSASLPAVDAPKTISVWMSYNAPPIGARQLLSLHDSASGCGLQLGLRAGRLGVWSGGRELVAAIAPRSRWHHVVYTFDGARHRLVIDGLVLPPVAGPAPACPVDQALVGSGPGGKESFQGSLDDLRIYNRALADGEIALLVAGDEPAQTPATDGGLRFPGDGGLGGPLAAGLVAYWPLDEGTGISTADLSGYENQGTLAGAPVWNPGGFPAARFANPFSLRLNGNGDQVDMVGDRLPALDQSLTASLWFNYTMAPVTGNRIMLSLSSSADACGIHIGTRGANLAVWGWGGALLVSRPAPPPGWHHLAYTFDGTTHTLQVDGQPPTTAAAATPQPCLAAEAVLGNYLGGREYFIGVLDDVRIWSPRALGPTDIAALLAGQR
jgi:hypothetical protein